jgi:hypothetical protein
MEVGPLSQDASHPEQPLRVLKVYEHLEKQGFLMSTFDAPSWFPCSLIFKELVLWDAQS